MERVSFITVETGDDLVLSFAVQCPGDAAEIESLILMRTPKYESLLEEHERGVDVSFERNEGGGDDYLQKIDYRAGERTVRIQTFSRQYDLDVSKIDEEDLKRMCKLLKKMNFDQRFQTYGI